MKKNESKWVLIPLLVVCNTLVYLLTSENYKGIGPGTTTDSMYYIQIADTLPYIRESIFPVLYPLFIRGINFFTGNYYLSTKIIGFVVILFSYLFTYYKKTFWKEFWALMAFPSVLGIYYFSMSEIILLPLLILFIYTNYNYFNNKTNVRKYIFWNTLILVLMCITKYSAVFIISGCFVFSVCLFFYNKSKSGPLFLSALFSGILVGGYLMMNHFYTGTFTGQRLNPIKSEMNITSSFFNILYVINPVVITRVVVGYKINYILLAIIDIFILALYGSFIWKNFRDKTKIKLDIAFYLVNSFIFLMMTIYTYFHTYINNLNQRLLFPYVFLFLTAVILSLNMNNKRYNILFIVAFSGVVLTILNGIYEYYQLS